MIDNPFPGPRPYRRTTDRTRFFGREAVAHKVECMILGHRSVTLYGPAASGKTSLMRTAVLPKLVLSDDIRVASVEVWPEAETPAARLASALRMALQYGDLQGVTGPSETMLYCAKRAARSSPRLLLVYLDQVEQVLYTNRDPQAADELFECLHQLAELPLRAIRIAISVREDHLGRLRDRLQDRRRLLDHSIRIAPLKVFELTEVACRAAALGTPPLTWTPERIGPLMLQVRAPGQPATTEADVQLAYAQILCRSLFQREAMNGIEAGEAIEGEGILGAYLEEGLSELGPLRGAAERLLMDHLLTPEGGRTLRTEQELLRLATSADPAALLQVLEKSAIVQAREHDGQRYLEIGHEWLARKLSVLQGERAREPAPDRGQAPPDPPVVALPRPREGSPEPGEATTGRLDLAVVDELRRQRRMLVAALAVLSAITLISAALSVITWRQQRTWESLPEERGGRP